MNQHELDQSVEVLRLAYAYAVRMRNGTLPTQAEDQAKVERVDSYARGLLGTRTWLPVRKQVNEATPTFHDQAKRGAPDVPWPERITFEDVVDVCEGRLSLADVRTRREQRRASSERRRQVLDALDGRAAWPAAGGVFVYPKDMEPSHRKNLLAFLLRNAENCWSSASFDFIGGPFPMGDAAADALDHAMRVHFDTDPVEWMRAQPMFVELARLVDQDEQVLVDAGGDWFA